MACQRLDEASAKEIFNNTDSFLFDCDGVLWDGKGVIPGSLETIKKLKESNKKVFYITNNSSKSRADNLEKLNHFGFPAAQDEVICTAFIAAAYLHSLNFKGKVYVMGSPSLTTELDLFGIRHIGGVGVKAVLVGYDTHISYMKIMKAASYLRHPDCLFLATNEDATLPAVNSPVIVPDTGPMVAAVSATAKRQPIVLGKPYPPMFEALRVAHNLIADRCLMTGDQLVTDIGLAANCGMRSLLVLSGCLREKDLPKHRYTDKGAGGAASYYIVKENVVCDPPPVYVPDFYTASLAQFGQFIASESPSAPSVSSAPAPPSSLVPGSNPNNMPDTSRDSGVSSASKRGRRASLVCWKSTTIPVEGLKQF